MSAVNVRRAPRAGFDRWAPLGVECWAYDDVLAANAALGDATG